MGTGQKPKLSKEEKQEEEEEERGKVFFIQNYYLSQF
jgi:hypothetical protein